MSNPPNWQNAIERTERLEASLDATRKSVSILQQRLADRTKELESRPVTRRQVIALLGGTVMILVTGAAFFYSEILPKTMARSISNNESLAKHFDNTDQRFKELEITLNGIRSDIKSLANARFLSAALKDAISGDESTLRKRLPDANRLLHQVKSMRVPLSGKEYREISTPLLSQYSSAKPPLKELVWGTLVEIANTRSSTDTVSQVDIEKAKTAAKYYEAVEVDLSSAPSWEGVIFRACKINLSNPKNDVSLKGVRFIDCDFNSMLESEAGRQLIGTFLNGDRSEVSATLALAKFIVLPPVFKEKKQ